MDYWRKFFRGANSDIFEVIEQAIVVAAVDCPNEFRARRDGIAEKLFTCKLDSCNGEDLRRKEVLCNNKDECEQLSVETLKASHDNSSLNNKVNQSSFTSPNPRSTSPQPVDSERMQISMERSPESEPEKVPFDILRPEVASPLKLNKSLLELNRGKRKEHEHAKIAPVTNYIRPGMVLLKNFIGLLDQVNIVNKCREIGVGPAGFYQPGFSNGSKLHLQMMCLGKDWNCESRLYGKFRSFDGAVPPEIPVKLRKVVDEALNASHKFLRDQKKDVQEIPKMSPDICVVNFYDNSGKLGLHQDRNESNMSLMKGLPIVSFSIGDSAEFLYSDARDVDNVDKILLESGDVLIFGGLSRHIYHGVSCIKPNTAPHFLTEKTKLRPGRLNLTFRQY